MAYRHAVVSFSGYICRVSLRHRATSPRHARPQNAKKHYFSAILSVLDTFLAARCGNFHAHGPLDFFQKKLASILRMADNPLVQAGSMTWALSQ
jgi:hypothetical protein